MAAGASLDAPASDGNTPLFEALHSEHTAVRATMVEALLAVGTNATARDDRGVAHQHGGTHLHYVAAGHADPTATEALLAAGADVGAQDDNGNTPLHWVAQFNENPAVVEVLARAGADVAANSTGNTPLHWAARHNRNPAVVEVLLAAGADVAARADDQETPPAQGGPGPRESSGC